MLVDLLMTSAVSFLRAGAISMDTLVMRVLAAAQSGTEANPMRIELGIRVYQLG